jgi:hypothetical protein
MDVVIGIGYQNAAEPLTFRNQVLAVVDRLGRTNAIMDGKSVSAGWGTEDGTWFAATFPSATEYYEARERIIAVGSAHNQDAVAFTFGTTDVAECPAPRAPRTYRDFL